MRIFSLLLLAAACTGKNRIAVDVGGAPQQLPEFPRVRCGTSDGPASDRVAPATPLPTELETNLKGLLVPMSEALLGREESPLEQSVCAVRSTLGPWRGVPDTLDSYRAAPTTPIASEVAISTLERDLLASLGKEPWTVLASSAGADVHRPLRESCDSVRLESLAMLLLPARRAEIEVSLRSGLRFLLETQRADGLFPFPDLEDEFVTAQAECATQTGAARMDCERALQGNPARLVKGTQEALRARGADVSAFFNNGWRIRDPLEKGNDGGLDYWFRCHSTRLNRPSRILHSSMTMAFAEKPC
jgi:hypothetical protein